MRKKYTDLQHRFAMVLNLSTYIAYDEVFMSIGKQVQYLREPVEAHWDPATLTAPAPVQWVPFGYPAHLARRGWVEASAAGGILSATERSAGRIDGRLLLENQSELRFSLEGSGRVMLTPDALCLVDPRLPPVPVPLILHYTPDELVIEYRGQRSTPYALRAAVSIHCSTLDKKLHVVCGAQIATYPCDDFTGWTLAVYLERGRVTLYDTGVQMEHSQWPATLRQGRVVNALSDGFYGGCPVRAGHHYVTYTPWLMEVPSTADLVLADACNRFRGPQWFDTLKLHSHLPSLSLRLGSAEVAGLRSDVETTVVGLESLTQLRQGRANLAVGQRTLSGLVEGSRNQALGSAFPAMARGEDNLLWAPDGGTAVTYAHGNVVVGIGALTGITGSAATIALGQRTGALDGGYSHTHSALLGHEAGHWTHSASAPSYAAIHSNTAVGAQALSGRAGVPASGNTAVGAGALRQENRAANLGGNVAVGMHALFDAAASQNTTALGLYSGAHGTQARTDSTYLGAYSGYANLGLIARGVSAIGSHAGLHAQLDDYATVVGYHGASGAVIGEGSVILGHAALTGQTCGPNSTAVGPHTRMLQPYRGTTLLGYRARATGDDQVQLGGPQARVQAFGAVHHCADQRDMVTLGPTKLGLAFIRQLKPVDYVLDARQAYADANEPPLPPTPPGPAPVAPALDPQAVDYHQRMRPYHKAVAQWSQTQSEYVKALAEYPAAVATWRKSQNLSELTRDGTHKQTQLRHGFVGQDVLASAPQFGGARVDGESSIWLGYSEFIAPLVKAVQEMDHAMQGMLTDIQALNNIVRNPVFIESIADRVAQMMQEHR